MNSKLFAILSSLLFIALCIPYCETSDNENTSESLSRPPPQIEIYSRVNNGWINTNVISNSGETNYFYHTTTLYCSSTSAFTHNWNTDGEVASSEGIVLGAACTDRQDRLIVASCIEFYQFESSTYPFIQIYWSPEYTYGLPEPDSGSNSVVDNLIFNLAGLAISELGGLGASIAWAIGSSIVCSNTNYNVDTNTYSARLFEWGRGTNNAMQQVQYSVRTNSDEISKYITEYSVIAYGIELLSAGKQLHVITGIDVMPPHWVDSIPLDPSLLEEVLNYSLNDSQTSDSNNLLIKKALEIGNVQCAVSSDNYHFTIDLPSVTKLEQDIRTVEDLQLVIQERLELLEKQSEIIMKTEYSEMYDEALCEFKITQLNKLNDDLLGNNIDLKSGCNQYFEIVHVGSGEKYADPEHK